MWRKASRWPWSARSALSPHLSSCGSERTTRLKALLISRPAMSMDLHSCWSARLLLKIVDVLPVLPQMRWELSAPPATCSSKVSCIKPRSSHHLLFVSWLPKVFRVLLDNCGIPMLVLQCLRTLRAERSLLMLLKMSKLQRKCEFMLCPSSDLCTAV